MDCRQSNSHSIVNLAKSMKEICDTLRKQVDVAYHLYKLFTYLLENFNDVSSISFEQVLSLASPASKSSSTAIPTAVEKPEYLHSSCKKLHDTGHLVYIDNPNVKKRWIILDQSALISEVNGVLMVGVCRVSAKGNHTSSIKLLQRSWTSNLCKLLLVYSIT